MRTMYEVALGQMKLYSSLTLNHTRCNQLPACDEEDGLV